MTAKRFYTAACNNSTPLYWVCAVDQPAAIATLTSAGIDFDPDEHGPLAWREMTAEEAAKVRCDTGEDDRGRGRISLSECELGEWFSSEW